MLAVSTSFTLKARVIARGEQVVRLRVRVPSSLYLDLAPILKDEEEVDALGVHDAGFAGDPRGRESESYYSCEVFLWFCQVGPLAST